MTATKAQQCEVCTGEEQIAYLTKGEYPFLQCTGCGHISVQLDISDAELVEVHDSHFFSDRAYVDYIKDRQVLQKNFSRFIITLRQYCPAGLLLEVGCAYGFFLELARQHWHVQGVDINEEATTFARKQLGLDVTCGDLLDLPIGGETHDIVTMWDTIEHLRYPAAYVSKISTILKPGGILALTTGDVGSLVARVRGRRWRLHYPPLHLHYFSRRTLAQLLGRFGLEIVEYRAVGFYRSLDVMLYRIFFDKKPLASRNIYLAATKMGLTTRTMYLNLFDIMLVIAKKF
jgi:2-polyprenyl-3-methyl-5-hydroxy-6-metoxy-1,4-benzoquinol methylase